MRKILFLLSILLLSINLSACKKEESTPIVNNQYVEVSEESLLVQANLWYSNIEETEDGKVYTYVIEVYSPDCFATPRKEDILYGEYANASSENQLVNQNVEITRYCTNENIGSKCETFFKIKSPEILDLTKLHVFFKGSKTYEDGMKITTEAEYKEKYEYSNWVGLFTRVNVDAVTTYDSLLYADHSQEEAIFVLYDGSTEKDLYYWNTSNSEIIIEDTIVWLPLNLDCITAGNYEKFYKHISSHFFIPYYEEKVSAEIKESFNSYDMSTSPFDVIFKYTDEDFYVGLKYNSEISEEDIPNGLYFISIAGFEYTFDFKN